MKQTFICLTLLLALLMASTGFAYNVTVKTSAGVGIASVTVSYNNCGGPCGTWSNTTTDGSGVATIPLGNNYVKVNYNLSSTGWVSTGGADITFYTTAVTARVLNCGNAVVPGASFRFNPGTDFGGTWLTGSSQELFAGTWCVGADIYGHVRNKQTPTVLGTNILAGQTLTVTFKTTKVTGGIGNVYCDPEHDGLYNYYRVGPFTPAGGVELLPGTYYFKINSSSSHYLNGAIVGPYVVGPGCTFVIPYHVTVLKSGGTPWVGITVSYGKGNGIWNNTTTDVSGVATIPGGNNYVRVMNNNLSSTGWVNTGGADITFYTTAVTAQVVNCGGAVVPGASFRFNPGATLGGTWLTGSSQELFAGQWCIGADIYGHVRNVQTPTLPGNNTTAGLTLTVTFTTTKVTIPGPSGNWYCDPSSTGLYNYFRLGPIPVAGIELLPGTYYFKNNSTNAHYLNGTVVGSTAISGCSMTLKSVTIKLLSSTGAGLPGGATDYDNGAGHTNIGLTNANGVAGMLVTSPLNGASYVTDFRVSYRQGGAGVGGYGIKTWYGIDAAMNPTLIATTSKVTSYLYDHTGVTRLVGAAQYDAGSGWQSMGNTTVSGASASIELLPGTYGFRVFYGGPNQSHPSVAVGAIALDQKFYTTLVTMTLWGGTSGGYVGGGTATYDNGSGWQLAGTTNAAGTSPSIEILSPSSWTYAFKMAYPGETTQQLNPLVAASPATQEVKFTFALLKQGTAGSTVTIPTEFGLSQNYPNPFNPTTTITVALPFDATVSLVVYNMLGEKVAELMNGTASAGYHDVVFDASNLASGLYVYRMMAKGNDGKDITKIQKMILMK